MSYPSNSDYRLTLDDVKPYLTNPKEKAGEIVAACPLCEADDPKGHHLYLKNSNDCLVLYCQKCEAPGTEIIRAFRGLGAKHYLPTEFNNEIIEDYDHVYRNTDGSVAYYKRRVKYGDGHKKFSFWYMDGSRKIYSKPVDCNVLYNLDGLENADADETLYIVEGEKCCDAMIDVGLLATTSNTGAKEKIPFTYTDLRLLKKFRNKVIIPDNDDKGKSYIKAWGNSCSVLDLKDIWEDCPPKADIYDYLRSVGDLQRITEHKTYRIDKETLSTMSSQDITQADFLKEIYRITEPLERQQALIMVKERAGELKCKRDFTKAWELFLGSMANNGNTVSNIAKLTDAPIDGLNVGEWIVDMKGVRTFKKDADGEFSCDVASTMPIIPTALLRNIENGSEKISLSFYRKGCWQTISVPRSTIANNRKIVELADLGIDVNSGTAKALVKYLADIINLNMDGKLPEVKTVSHLGWIGEEFLPYTDKIVCDVGIDMQDLVDSICENGSYEEWIDYVKPLRKALPIRLMMASAFASPIMSKVNASPFIFHLWGASGCGKTVAAMVAASIYGNPELGKMIKSLNNTINYLMTQLGTFKHLPFFGDELQTIKDNYGNYDTLIMRVCEGIDRGRMNATGIIQKVNSWRNVMITTGEEPCTKDNSGGGAKNRVIEFECDKDVITDGNAISNFVRKHYGHAGKVFVESLNQYELMDEYIKIRYELQELAGSTAKQIMAMSLMLLADKIASEQIFHDDPLIAADVCKTMKSFAEVDTSERAFQYITDFISENTLKFETDFDSVKNGTMWGERKPGGAVKFNKSILERELRKAGFDFDSCKKNWAERGYLSKNSQGRYYGSYWVNGVKGNYVVLNI